MRKFFKHPWLIVAVIGAITVFFAIQLPRAQLDNNNFRFVPEKDPSRIELNKIDDTFGSQVFILVGLERKYNTVFDAEFLNKLKTYVDTVKKIDMVDSVTSIASTDYISGQGDAILVEPLVPEGFTGTSEEIALLKDHVLGWDLYRRFLVSDDFKSTQIMVSLKTKTEEAGTPATTRAYQDIKRLAQEAGFPGTNIYITGVPVMSAEVNTAMDADLVFLIPLVIIVVLLVLLLSFRRVGGIVLPLLTVAVSAIWAIGAMPLVGVRLSILSTVLPVILVAVGSAYGIHVVSHYYDETAGKYDLSKEEHRELVFSILRKVGWPVFLAAITTFAGFVSFCFTKVVPIFEFGIFSSFGVMVAFGISVTLIPALYLIRGPARKPPRMRPAHIDKGTEDPLSSALADGLCLVAKRKRSTLFLAAATVLVCIFGVSHLVIDNVLVEYFKPSTDVVRSDRFIRSSFGGSKEVSVVVSSSIPGEVLRPDVLAAMDGLASYLKTVPEVGKTTGFTDMLKRINQVYNADESPDGIKPIAAAQEPEQGSAASGVDGGSPAFGFGAADSAQAEPAFGFSKAPDSPPGKPISAERGKISAEPLDSIRMAELLNRALAKSESWNVSAEDLTRQVYRAVNYRGMSYYEIPTDPERYGKKTPEELKALISNYLVLLSGNISSFADDPLEPKAIRMNVQMRTVGQIDTDRVLKAIRTYTAENFPKDVHVEIGGTALVEGALNQLVVQSQLISVILSLLMVFLILSIYYRSAMAGLIGLAPLSLSILINFALMGFCGIKLNIGTAMVASIAVGIGIDYTIHYMAAYHHEYLATEGKGDFIRRTFLTSGKAILSNAVSVGAGFAVLMLSQFNILADLGLLIAITMGTSALTSLTLLPVLLTMIHPAFIQRPLPHDFEKAN
jgi:uncharacterized protein